MRSGSRQHRGEAGGGWLFGFPPLLATDGRIHKGDCDMRTGAIFARGSCRALKWMALVGMVFALGVGSVAAQQTLSGGDVKIEVDDSTEGQSTTISVTVSAEIESVAANTGTATTVVVTVAAATLSAVEARALGVTPAEYDSTTAGQPDDYALGTGDTVELEFVFPKEERTPTGRSFPHTLAPKTVELQTRNHDDDAEDEGLRVTATPAAALTGGTAVTKDVKIMDDEDQTYVLALAPATQSLEEGDEVTVSLMAMPAHVQDSTVLTVNIDKPSPDYGFTIAVVSGSEAAITGTNQVRIGVDPDTATNAVTTATITLNTPPDDMNRVLDTVMMTAHSGQPGAGVLEATLPIDLADNNALPAITAALTDANGMAVTDGMLTEGNTYMLTLSAPAAVREDITVSVTQAGGTAMSTDDYSLGQSLIMIPTGQTSSAAVSLEIDLNDDIENDTLVFMAEVAGEVENGTETNQIAMLLSLTLVDATTKLVTVATDAMTTIYGAIDTAEGDDGKLNPGERITLMKSALFDAVTGWVVRVDADTDDSGVAYIGDEGEEVWITPRAPGTATITITGTAVEGASSFEGGNLSRDVAEIKFMVTVELAPPGPPRNLTATAGDGQVWLRWDKPNTGGEHSGYEYRVDAGDWNDRFSDDPDVEGFWVGDLTNGEDYVFELRAVNAAGMSEAVSVKETPVATPVDESQVVTVKSVSAATSVAESGGLEVTVTATVPAGTKGADDKVAPIASKHLYVSFPTDDPSIADGEAAEAGDLTILGDLVWEKIARTEKESEASFKFRVAIGQDLDAEDEKFQVSVSIDGDAKKSKVVTVDDAQEQTYVLSLPAAAKGAIAEGKSETLTLKADPAKTVNIPFTLTLEPNDPSRYTLSDARGFVGVDVFETTVGTKADSDRTDDTLTVSVHAERQGNLASLDITVTDANALPAVEATLVDKDGKALDPQPESVMEGETVMVMLTAVDKDGKATKAAEKLTITLMPTGTADASDYRLSSQSIEIASGKESSAAVDLMITEDQDIGDETLMFDAAVGGEAKNGTEKRSVAGVLSVMITDGTKKLVYAKTQEEVEAAIYAAKNAGAGDDMTFTAGEMIEVMGSALFSAAEGVTLSYTAESSMSGVASASVSGGTVMVTAVAEGMTDITITAHASMASGVKILDQTDPGMASIMFPVEVGLEALSIMLSGPEDMNLAEGMSAMVTATANREVSADTMVMLMHDRSMSSAGDADYEAEAITIAVGEMMGSTMVMAVEDNMMEDMEELVLYGMTEGMAGEVTGEVKFYLWDAAVPALPVIAQLLLAAFLAVGGYRRYRRR